MAVDNQIHRNKHLQVLQLSLEFWFNTLACIEFSSVYAYLEAGDQKLFSFTRQPLISTEIFSKRRKICPLQEDKRE